MARITNEEVRQRTDQPPLTHVIRTTRLKFFSHSARADPWTTVEPLGPAWPFAKVLEPPIRPLHHTWLRTVDPDLAQLSSGMATAYHRAQIVNLGARS